MPTRSLTGTGSLNAGVVMARSLKCDLVTCRERCGIRAQGTLCGDLEGLDLYPGLVSLQLDAGTLIKLAVCHPTKLASGAQVFAVASPCQT